MLAWSIDLIIGETVEGGSNNGCVLALALRKHMRFYTIKITLLIEMAIYLSTP